VAFPGEWPAYRRYSVGILVPCFLDEVAPFGLTVGRYRAGLNITLGDLFQKKNDFKLAI
jgi:hypothetical protein